MSGEGKDKMERPRFEIYWLSRHWPISAGISFTVLGVSFLRFAGGGKQIGVAILGFAATYNFGNRSTGPMTMQSSIGRRP
jgi:hypothetical protein